MPGVFDRLQQQIEIKRKVGGMTAMDMAELSPAMRRIMRLLLREVQMDYRSLCEAMSLLSPDERLSDESLNSALDILTRQFWLTRIGTGANAVYKVNLRRRTGTSLPSSIWMALDKKLKQKSE